MPTIYNFTLPRIILKQRAPKIDIVPDTICPKFNDLLLMFWQIFVCSAKSAKDNNKQTAQNYLISRKKSAAILACLLRIKMTDIHNDFCSKGRHCQCLQVKMKALPMPLLRYLP